ncbi:MAG: SDR family oxidoreductase [Victivallales bacterium]|nr:SDR family oxidoreductase [Victivallales bacterium]
MDIKGKRVLVTGGAVRIGRALCQACAEAGAQVVIHCHKSVVQAEELRNLFPGSGHEIVQCNLNSPAETAGLLEKCGHIDILINNAAVYYLAAGDAAAEEQMQVNYFAPVSLMEQFAAQKPPGGCIINFLDQEVAGETEAANPYLYSKLALRDATLTAALAGAPGFRVNAIAPGPALPPVGLKGPGMEKILKKVPMGKQIPLRDITGACLFLIRNDSLTGQIIYVDGGQHLT